MTYILYTERKRPFPEMNLSISSRNPNTSALRLGRGSQIMKLGIQRPEWCVENVENVENEARRQSSRQKERALFLTTGVFWDESFLRYDVFGFSVWCPWESGTRGWKGEAWRKVRRRVHVVLMRGERQTWLGKSRSGRTQQEGPLIRGGGGPLTTSVALQTFLIC